MALKHKGTKAQRNEEKWQLTDFAPLLFVFLCLCAFVLRMTITLAFPATQSSNRNSAAVILSGRGTVRLDQFFFETASGRTTLPALPNGVVTVSGRALNQTMTADGHNIR